MRLSKTPIYVGVRLPLRLRLWPEMWAGEEHVSTSTLIRRWIEERAKVDVQKAQGDEQGEERAARATPRGQTLGVG